MSPDSPAGESSETPEITEPSGQEEKATQPDSGQSQEDNFFDPNQVPEELKGAYKQMQAAFTKKTQEIAEFKKQFETVKQKADAYAKYEQHIPIVEEMLKGKQQPSNEMAVLEQQLKQAGYTPEAIEMMKIGTTFALQQFNAQRTEEQRETIQRETNQKIEDAGRVDPRLMDQSLQYTTDDGETLTYGQIVERFVASQPNWFSDPIAATKKAIKLVDALIGKAKTEGKEELSSSAKQKASKFAPVGSSPQKGISTAQPKNMREAAALANQELGYH